MFKINQKFVILALIVVSIILTIIVTIFGLRNPTNNGNIKNDVAIALTKLVNISPQIASKGHSWPTQNIPSNTENLSKIDILKGTELYKKLNIDIDNNYVLYFTSDKIKNAFVNIVNNTDNINNPEVGQIEYYYAFITGNAYDVFIPDNYIKSNDTIPKSDGLDYNIATTTALIN